LGFGLPYFARRLPHAGRAHLDRLRLGRVGNALLGLDPGAALVENFDDALDIGLCETVAVYAHDALIEQRDTGLVGKALGARGGKKGRDRAPKKARQIARFALRRQTLEGRAYFRVLRP